MQNPEETEFIFVGLDSIELKLFFQRFHDDVADLIRHYVCTKCWGIIRYEHRKIHSFHKQHLLQAITVSNEELYFETAQKYGMIKNNTIAILRTSHDLMRDHDFAETRVAFNAS